MITNNYITGTDIIFERDCEYQLVGVLRSKSFAVAYSLKNFCRASTVCHDAIAFVSSKFKWMK